MNGAEIRGKLPSLNEYIDACRRNKYAGAKMKHEAERLIIAQIGRMKPITQRSVIVFTWHEKTRQRDPDNVAAAKKFVLDALQRAGKLPNDNSQYIAGFTDCFVYGKEYGVTIEVEPITETKRGAG